MEPAVTASDSGPSDHRLLVAVAIVAVFTLGGFLWVFNFTDFF